MLPFWLMSIGDVCGVTGLGKTAQYQLIREDKFPAPYKPFPGSKLSRWRSDEVFAWVEAHTKPQEAASTALYSDLKAGYWDKVKAGEKTPPKPRITKRQMAQGSLRAAIPNPLHGRRT